MADGYVLSEKDYQLFKDMAANFRKRLQGDGGNERLDLAPPSSDVYVIALNEGEYISARNGQNPGKRDECNIYRIKETYRVASSSPPVPGSQAEVASVTLELIELGDDPFQKRVYNVHARGIPACGYHIVEKLKGGGWVVQPYEMVPYRLVDCNGARPSIFVLNDLAEYLGSIVKWDGVCWRVSCGTVGASPGAFNLAPGYIALDQYSFYGECEDCSSCWKLTECVETDPEIIYTNSNFSAAKYKVVRCNLEDDPEATPDIRCFYVEPWTDCRDAIPRTALTVYDDCDPCSVCYTLENCLDPNDTIKIFNDLATIVQERRRAGPPARFIAADLEPGDTLGVVFRVAGGCYKVIGYGVCGEEAYYAQDLGKMYETQQVPLPDRDNPAGGPIVAACDRCACLKLVECDANDNSGPASIIIRTLTLEGEGVIDLEQEEEGDDGEVVASWEGKSFRLATTGKCYGWEKAEDCPAPEAATAIEVYDECLKCVIYTLTSCDDPETTIKTYTDLMGLYGNDVVGKVIKDSVDLCWTVTNKTGTFADSVEWDPNPDFPKAYGSCPACNGTLKYKLVNDCHHQECGSDPTARADDITDFDLSEHIGKYTKYQGSCSKISAVDTGDITIPKAEVTAADFPVFEDCETCTSAVVPIRMLMYGKVYIDGETLKQETTLLTVMVDHACPRDPVDVSELYTCPPS